MPRVMKLKVLQVALELMNSKVTVFAVVFLDQARVVTCHQDPFIKASWPDMVMKLRVNHERLA